MDDLYVLEWSRGQNCFHIQRAFITAKNNLAAFLHDKPLNDYHVLMFGSFDECHKAADRLRHKIIQRDMAKSNKAIPFAQ